MFNLVNRAVVIHMHVRSPMFVYLNCFHVHGNVDLIKGNIHLKYNSMTHIVIFQIIGWYS